MKEIHTKKIMEMMHVVLVPALARLVFLLVLLAMVTLFVVVMQDILVLMELIVLHAQHALVTTTLAKQAQKIVFHVAKTRQVLLL